MPGSWTDIADATFDADSPTTATLWEDVIENTEYNNDHALRGGTHASGVRLGFARGKSSEFSIVTDGSGNGNVTWNITISSATDGDPNFSATPTAIGFVCEDSGGGTAWNSLAVYSVRITGGSSTVINTRIAVAHAGATVTIKGYLYWNLVGAVSSGE